MIASRWLLPLVLLGTVMAVASLLLFLRPIGADESEPTRLVVRDDSVTLPWCDEDGLVCVTRESLDQGYALYTLEPHSDFRAKGCRALWLPEFDLANVGSQGRGAFRSPCSGATFDRLGRRLFGPSERALDRYPLEATQDGFEVDLTVLQPGP